MVTIGNMRVISLKKAMSRSASAEAESDAIFIPTAAELRTKDYSELDQTSVLTSQETFHEELDTEPDSLEYRELSSADAEVRLLTLLPSGTGSGHSEDVRCTLEHVSLYDAPEYYALSYTWGNAVETRPIWINGKRVNVTFNLYHALSMLRLNEQLTVWVDALCINQEDREEKSQQIQRMRTIYARSKQVVVWLGLESHDSNLAMWLLDLLSDPYKERPSLVAYNKAREEREALSTPGPFAEAWTAFDNLFAREYWKRVWVIQEITVGQRVVIFCGQQSLPWLRLKRALWLDGRPCNDVHCTDKSHHLHWYRSGLPPPRQTPYLFDYCTWRDNNARGISQPLLCAIVASQGCKATNATDHIYGLLGICSDSAALVPLPNYKISVEKAYQNFTAALIRKTGNLAIICLRNRDGGTKRVMPSWVPEWSDLASTDRAWLKKLILDNQAKSQDRGTRVSTQHIRSIKDGVLSLRGRIWGCVSGLTTGMLDEITPAGDMIQSNGKTVGHANARQTSKSLNYTLVRPLLRTPSGLGPHGAKLVSYLTRPEGLQIMQSHNHHLLRNWLAANSQFQIAGTTLGQWTSTFPDKLDVHMRLLKQIPSFKHKPTFEEELHNYISDAEAALRVGMRLVVSEEGYIGMAHPQTRKGDYICSIAGLDQSMSWGFAVVLRPYEDMPTTTYNSGEEQTMECRVVGEAYMMLNSNQTDKNPEIMFAIR
jgi:hypothetical protein